MSDNNHQNPNNQQQPDENLLRESEEISLGIKPKVNLHKPKHTHNTRVGRDNTLPLSNEIKKHNFDHSNNLGHTYKTHSKANVKINLAPIDIISDKNDFEPDKKQKRIIKRINKARKHKYWRDAKLVVGTVLFFFLVFNSQWFISRIIYTFSKPDQQASQKPTQQNENNDAAEATTPQNEIIIPKIGVRAPIIFAKSNKEEDIQTDLRDGVVHYYGTANPGEIGNSVIFGHSSDDWWEAGNYKFIFVLLEKMEVGDTYEINYNSKKYVYEVTSTKVVEPNDLSVLNQSTEPTSTLITCTPPGTDWKRFIVYSKQVSPKPNQANDTKNQPPELSVTESKLPSNNLGFWDRVQNFFGSLWGGENKNKQNQDSNQPKPRLPEIN